MHCADQSVKTYDNADIQAINAVNNRDISLTLKKEFSNDKIVT